MDEAAKRAQREYYKQYKEANKEKVAAAKKKYYQENRDRINEYSKQWKRNNPDKIRQYTENYWTKKAQAAGHHCLNCNDPFEPKRSDAKYCSDKCRIAYNRNKKQ